MIAPFAPKHRFLVVTAVFAPYAEVQHWLQSDLPMLTKSNWTKHEGQLKLEDCFADMPPAGAAHDYRVLALDAKASKATIITANLMDGWSSLAFRYSRSHKAAALVMGFCSDTVEFPARFFTYVNKGEIARSVSVRKDPRWIFHQQGKILEEENPEAYSRRRIAQRLLNTDLLHLADRFEVCDLVEERPLSAAGCLHVQRS